MYIKVIGLVLALSLIGVQADPNVKFTVSRKHIQCVIEHIDVYLEVDKDVVFISLPDCPEIPESVTLLSTVYNADPGYSKDQLDTFVFLTKPQLQCLSNVTLPPDIAEFYFFPSDCDLRASNE